MYRVYVTDCLQGIGHFNRRYFDILDRFKHPVDEKDPDEIITRISDKLNNMGRR